MSQDRPEWIVLDFGNVLIDLDYERHFSRFKALFGKRWPARNYPAPITRRIEQYERGEISDDTLVWEFQQLNAGINPRLIADAWNSLIDRLDPLRLEMLESLRKRYKLALLSNINALHLRHIRRQLLDEHRIQDFESRYFDKCFYSHELGMRKPEQGIYAFVQKKTGCSANKILFIDDREENIAAARREGWRAVQHVPGTCIAGVMDQYLENYAAYGS